MPYRLGRGSSRNQALPNCRSNSIQAHRSSAVRAELQWVRMVGPTVSPCQVQPQSWRREPTETASLDAVPGWSSLHHSTLVTASTRLSTRPLLALPHSLPFNQDGTIADIGHSSPSRDQPQVSSRYRHRQARNTDQLRREAPTLLARAWLQSCFTSLHKCSMLGQLLSKA